MTSPATDNSVTPKRQNIFLRWTYRIIRALVFAYVGVCLIVFSIQRSYVFPGASATQGQKDGVIAQGYNNKIVALKSFNGVPIVALFGGALSGHGTPLPYEPHRPTVIYFYGNGACMAYSTGVFEHLRRQGLNVIIPDYEGYGMSGGKPSEQGCYAAADAAYAYLLSRNDIDSKCIVAMGWSLGAAVATDLASRKPVAGLVTVSGFTSLHAMSQRFVKWLPMSLILRYQFDNIDKFRGISCPIFIAHGTQDELIPFDMSNELAAAAKGKVTRFNIDGAQHNDVFEVGGLQLTGQIGMFVRSVTSSTAAASQPAPAQHY